jgi:hypothetical protein
MIHAPWLVARPPDTAVKCVHEQIKDLLSPKIKKKPSAS